MNIDTDEMPRLAVVRGTLDGADCANCPFAVDGRAEKPVFGIGPASPEMIFVGEGPGMNERNTGVPFVGASGELVNRALGETGVDRSKLWITNSTLCLPTKKAGEKEKRAAAQACKQRLERELMDRPDIPVLALGGIAAAALLSDVTKLPITEIAGAHFEHDVDGSGVRSVIPTVHPAAILRASGDGDKGPEKTGGHVADLAFWSLRWDILKVKALAAGRDIRLHMRRDQEIFIELVDPNRARELVWDLICRARDQQRLTIDLETYVDDPLRNFALQAFIAKIRLLGLAAGGIACSVKWDLLDDVIIEEFAKVLADETIVKGYHNATYDTAVLQNQWYRFVHRGPIEDTMLAQHAIWPGAKKKLQHVASQYRAVAPWKSEFRDIEDSDDPEAEAVYNASDVLATEETIGPSHLWIKRQKVEKVYEADRVKAQVCAQMHLKGYYVDPDVNTEIKRRLKLVIDESNETANARCEEIKEAFYRKLAAERAKTQRKADPEGYGDRIRVREAELAKEVTATGKSKFTFKLSNDWHAAAFLKAAGVPLWQTTDGGRTATGGAVLEKFSQFPEVDALIRLRANEQLYEGLGLRMFEWTQDSQGRWRAPFVQDDGRCHPIWSGTQISGRHGSVVPASSNWTTGDETNADPRKRLPNIRRQLTVPPPINGRRRAIVAFDKEQLEARLIAVQSGDPFLCSIFAEGKDIHHEFGALVFTGMLMLDKTSDEYQDLRNLTKRVEYGAIYGGADATVHKAIVSDQPKFAGQRGFEMIRASIAKMKRAIPGVFAWQQRLLRETSRPPYTLRSYLLGRCRIFPLGNPPPTDIANNPNQFAGADVMDIGLMKFLPRLEKYEDAFFILNQHDADYIECYEDDAEAIARDVDEAFYMEVEAVNGQMIAFPNEVKIGYAYHSEASDKQKALHPQLVWPCGAPGLKKFKIKQPGVVN
jgi:DNA polymerase